MPILNNHLIVPFSVGRRYINEGDVLLYRGQGIVSKLIKWSGRGHHSHAGMASWRGAPRNSLLEVIEYREWIGSRVSSLDNQVKQFPKLIDVYRVSPEVIELEVSEKFTPVPVDDKIEVIHELDINQKKLRYHGREATDLFRSMTALPYGWKRIWKMARYNIPLLRFFVEPSYDDKTENGKLYPVCSTILAYLIRVTYIDIIPNLSDFEVSPSDLARCSDLQYLFTLDIG